MASITEPAIPSTIQDYHVLPLSLPSLPSLDLSSSSLVHYIYLKPHAPSIPTPESPRSLFLVNIPIDSTASHFKHLFSIQLGLSAGRIVDVQFEKDLTKDRTSATTPPVSAAPSANVSKKNKKRKRVHENDDAEDSLDSYPLPSTWDRQLHRSGSKVSMEAVLKAARGLLRQRRTVVWGEGVEEVEPLGAQRELWNFPTFTLMFYTLGDAVYNPLLPETASSKLLADSPRLGYLTHHSLTYPSKSDLLASVNAYMTAYNRNQEALAAEQARKRQQPDEEGFVTVTRGGRNAAVRMEVANERLEKQKQKQEVYGDFYRFQGREARKKRAEELKRRFEEDRERVERMRRERGRLRPE